MKELSGSPLAVKLVAPLLEGSSREKKWKDVHANILQLATNPTLRVYPLILVSSMQTFHRRTNVISIKPISPCCHHSCTIKSCIGAALSPAFLRHHRDCLAS